MPVQGPEEILGFSLRGLSQQLEQLHQELQNANQLNTTLIKELETSRFSMVEVLVQAMDAREAVDPGHSRRVVKYSLAMATELGLNGSESEGLQYGVLLHDVGKLCISDTILNKPGPLTEEEWGQMRRHPELGHQLLRGLRFLESALPVVLYHHEHFDGSGYPYHLKEDEIPQKARIFAVADAFDAMTSDRPYRKATRPEVASEEILRCSGAHFDPDVVNAFMSAVIVGLGYAPSLVQPAAGARLAK